MKYIKQLTAAIWVDRLFSKLFKRKPKQLNQKEFFDNIVKNIAEDAPKVDIPTVLPNYSNPANLEEVLHFDPLHEAGEITGSSYKDDKPTEALGFLLHVEHAKQTNAMLERLGDTTFSNQLDRYTEIVLSLGFELALELQFVTQSPYDKEGRDERYFIYAHRTEGLILAFDTYKGGRVNGGNVYSCWRPSPGIEEYPMSIGGSGSWESALDPDWRRNPKYNDNSLPDDCFITSRHDCQEALCHKINRMRENGTFLSPWPKNNMFMWLLHSQDKSEENYDYRAITRERISMLPDWVKEILKDWDCK